MRMIAIIAAAWLIAGIASDVEAAQRLQPLSKTAQSITGAIVLDARSVRFGRRATVKLGAVGTAVPFDGGFGIGKITADLYRVLTPDDPVLIRGNRLCGSGKPLTFLLVWTGKGISGPVTTLAPSTSATPPATMDDVCGTFTYGPEGLSTIDRGHQRRIVART